MNILQLNQKILLKNNMENLENYLFYLNKLSLIGFNDISIESRGEEVLILIRKDGKDKEDN